ncbi:MAG: alpha/beta hydrolase [Clostridiaceae bacterium]|nr:alpha/beta hydrolase [Clostridiaceae bacterium]
MTEKTYETGCGTIHYWVNMIDADKVTLVFLPGLTSDHRLFDKQIEYFQGKYNVFVWDAPAHAASWPFEFKFTLPDKVNWLNEMLERENMTGPVIVGQSMGGFVGQVFAELYPEKLKGFVAIDSIPIQRKYMSDRGLRMLKNMESMYARFPWKLLSKVAVKGSATSEYGRKLAREMMTVYEGDRRRYFRIAGHGFIILAEAIEKDLPYAITCPVLLICGRKDRIRFCVKSNKAWHRDTGIPLEWIKDAGHNANTDQPEIVNGLIESFLNENGLG